MIFTAAPILDLFVKIPSNKLHLIYDLLRHLFFLDRLHKICIYHIIQRLLLIFFLYFIYRSFYHSLF